MFEQVLNEIKKYDTIIIHRHTFPDGDAIGSQAGLKDVLKANFPSKKVYAVGDDPGRYSFIEDSAPDDIDGKVYEGALAIILDSAAKSLISDSRYINAEKTIRIDHHIWCEKIADIEIIDTTYESCAGLIAEFIRESGLKLTQKAAKAIYTGMVTDSGRFRHDPTTPRTFRLAAFLADAGFSLDGVYRQLYSSDFEYVKLRARFVLKIRFTEKNVAYIITTKEELTDYGADAAAISRGMVNVMADIKGVNIWVNFTESDGCFLCELRSDRYNINKVAVKYGGGGHEKASGAKIKDKKEIFKMLADLDKIADESAPREENATV